MEQVTLCDQCRKEPATVRVYWVEPDTKPDDPAAGEAELCPACLDYTIEPWRQTGDISG